MRGREQPPVVRARRVDCVQHRRIGGEHDARAAVVPVRAEIAERHIRQIILKCVLRLPHESDAVGEEKDVRDVPAAAQHIHKARSGARLSRPRRHDEQMPPHAALHLRAYGADGLLLIIAVRDFIVYPDGRKRTAPAPAVRQLLQIRAAENAAHSPLWPARVVPEKSLESVRREHHRTPAEFAF